MTNPRQDKLLKLLHEHGYCSNEELAKQLDVSTQTIRRDIKKLGAEFLLVRHHGGAGSLHTKDNLAYEVRIESKTQEKNIIAQHIAQLIPDGSTLFITIGTTAEIIAQHLLEKQNLQIMTNSLRVASLLHMNKSFDVSIPSGKIKSANGGIIGTDVMAFAAKFRFDYLITSAASVDQDGTLLEYDLFDAMVTKSIMNAARKVIIALDSSKYTPRGSVELCQLTDVDYLVTDKKPPAFINRLTESANIKVIS